MVVIYPLPVPMRLLNDPFKCAPNPPNTSRDARIPGEWVPLHGRPAFICYVSITTFASRSHHPEAYAQSKPLFVIISNQRNPPKLENFTQLISTGQCQLYLGDEITAFPDFRQSSKSGYSTGENIQFSV